MRAIWSALLLSLCSQVATEEALLPLVDFVAPDVAQRWQAVNDGVMGGISDGRFKITDDKTLEFFGTLSLENNGGFASVRTKPTALGIKAGDTLVARVRGDGREYVLNLYTKSRRMAFSYRSPLTCLPLQRGQLRSDNPGRWLGHTARDAFHLYESFRPGVPEGIRGWGAKGLLDLRKLTRSGWRSRRWLEVRVGRAVRSA